MGIPLVPMNLVKRARIVLCGTALLALASSSGLTAVLALVPFLYHETHDGIIKSRCDLDLNTFFVAICCVVGIVAYEMTGVRHALSHAELLWQLTVMLLEVAISFILPFGDYE
jgi:hypothetical protein